MNELMQRLGINANFNYLLIFATLIWVRMLAITNTIPFLFGKPVPQMVRTGASMILAAFAYKYLAPREITPIAEDTLLLVMLYIKEIFIGVLIGFGSGFIFYGFEAAGQMIDSQRGTSIARLLIPELGQQTSLSGALLFQLAIVTYLTIGGHRLFFNSIFESYQVIPIFEFPNVQDGLMPLMDFFIVLSGQIIALSIQIAAPVIIAILIADIILGVANRIAPQINVWELGFNVKGYLGILALFWAITMIINQMEHYSDVSGQNLMRVLEMLKSPVQP